MTMTCLSLAVMSCTGLTPKIRRVGVGQEVEGEVDAVELAARNLHIARHAGADGHYDGVVTVTQVIHVMSLPISTLVRKRVPSASICLTRRSSRPFSSLKFGMP